MTLPLSPTLCFILQAMLVHPDKNMGSPLASESFKKLQCAYEVNINHKMQFYMFVVIFLVAISPMDVMEIEQL